jgi:hypothetical protein
VTVTALLLLTTSTPMDRLAGIVDDSPGGRLLVRDPAVESDGGTIRRGDPGLYGLVWELHGDRPAALVSSAATVAGLLGDGVDASRSIALAGHDHVMLAGSGPAVLIYALRGLRSLTLEAFHNYWSSVHAEFGRRALAGQGYRQLHADPALSAEVARSAGLAGHDLDGAVVSESTSWDDYFRRRERPEMRAAGSAALADEDNFIDHTRSMTMRYTEVGSGGG